MERLKTKKETYQGSIGTVFSELLHPSHEMWSQLSCLSLHSSHERVILKFKINHQNLFRR